MSVYTEDDLAMFIWKHYQDLIDKECDYLSMVRAQMFYRHTESQRKDVIQEKDRKYLEMPRDWLMAELMSFQGEKKKRIALDVAKKYADQIHLNVCPHCGRLPMSPQAEYCLHCRASWRWKNPLRRMTHQAQNDD